MNKRISKREAHRIFVDKIFEKAIENGYVRRNNRLERRIGSEELNIQIIPDFATHTGEMVFDVFIVVIFASYERELKRFNESTYPGSKLDCNDILTILISDAFKENRDYADDLYGYIDYFISNFSVISQFVEENFSTRKRILGYFEADEYSGGADRALAIYTLMCAVEGKDAACRWLRSEAPYTASEYQREQLSYLSGLCA